MKKTNKTIFMFEGSYERMKEIADKRGMNMAGVILFLLTLYEKEEANDKNR